jgi:hypothetical protein
VVKLQKPNLKNQTNPKAEISNPQQRGFVDTANNLAVSVIEILCFVVVWFLIL